MSVFTYSCSADVPLNSNRELFASVSAEPAELLSDWLDKAEDGELAEQLRRVHGALSPCRASGESHILTDDKAPVELLGMSMIDSLISGELAYYKGIYEEEGVKGLLKIIE